MKIVVNKCFGGFSLSPRAIKRLAELQGRECYFFKTTYDKGEDRYIPVNIDAVENSLFFIAFDIPNPNEVCDQSNFSDMTPEERKISNENYEKHCFSDRSMERTDPLGTGCRRIRFWS